MSEDSGVKAKKKSVKKTAKTAEGSSSEKAKREGRFIGWQQTPIHQASFGGATKGGSANESYELKNSTGPVQVVTPTWHLLDASKTPVGRLATVAASLLSGKHLSTFTPGAGSGDYVVVINADKAFFTSNKSDKKMYYWHTGWFGGLKMETAREALKKHPEKVLYDAVQGMMPKSNLSKKQLVHLKIYNGTEHPHRAQNPVVVDLEKSGLKSLVAA